MSPIREEMLTEFLLHLPVLVKRIRKLASIHPRVAATDAGRQAIVETIAKEAQDVTPDEVEYFTLPAVRAITALIVRTTVERYRTAKGRAHVKRLALTEEFPGWQSFTAPPKGRKIRYSNLRRELREAEMMALVWGSEP